jgi:hypothetical protein
LARDEAPSRPKEPGSRGSGARVALLGALVTAGCDRPSNDAAPPPSAEPLIVGAGERAHAEGEVAHAHDYSMSVESTKDCPLDPPFRAQRGFVKAGIEVVIEGTSNAEVPVNPFYATLEEPGGATRNVTLAGCEPAVPSVRVTRGEKVRGFLTFEIPATTRRFELRYAPLVIGAGPEVLRFSLTR